MTHRRVARSECHHQRLHIRSNRCGVVGGFVAVQLQQVRIGCGNDGVDHGIIGIDEQGDDPGTAARFRSQRRGDGG